MNYVKTANKNKERTNKNTGKSYTHKYDLQILTSKIAIVALFG